MQVNERTPEERCSEFSLAADPRTYFLIDAVTGQMSGNPTYRALATSERPLRNNTLAVEFHAD
jgi:hypothetical protein